MQEGGSDHYNHYQLPSADNELNNGADKWRRPKRDGHKTACDAYKVGESKDQEESGDECAEKWQLRVYKCVRVGVCVWGRKEGSGGQKRKRKALLSGNISPFGFVRREPRLLHNLCQYFYKWQSAHTRGKIEFFIEKKA